MSKGTIVIILAQDHAMLDDKPGDAFGDVLEMAKNMQEEGINVVLIGDGKKNLSLDDIKLKLEQIKDPNTTLFIGAHGGALPSIFGHEELIIDGVSSGNWITDFNYISELYKIVPPNFTTVIQSSCSSGIAIHQANENLPKGTLFLPMGNEQSIFSDYWSSFHSISQSKSYTTMDMYLQLLIESHSKSELGLDEAGNRLSEEELSKEYSIEGERLNKKIDAISISRTNMPTHFVIAGEDIINVEETLKSAKGNQYSDNMLAWWSERLHNVLIQKDYHLITDEEKNSLLAINGHEDIYYAQKRMPMLRRIADKITAGTLSEGDPDYAVGYAMIMTAIEVNNPQFGLKPKDTVLALGDSSDKRLVAGDFKYQNEIRGILSQLSPEQKKQIAATSLGRDFGLTGSLNYDVLSVSFVFEDHGVKRAEQFGNGDDEITFSEFMGKLNEISAKSNKGRR